jgi:hypothetical protein
VASKSSTCIIMISNFILIISAFLFRSNHFLLFAWVAPRLFLEISLSCVYVILCLEIVLCLVCITVLLCHGLEHLLEQYRRLSNKYTPVIYDEMK